MNQIKKIALAVSGSVAALVTYVSAAASAHAAGFTVSTSTVNDTAGTLYGQGWDYVLSLITSGGTILFMVAITLLGGIIFLVLWGVSRIFKRKRV